MKKTKKLLKSIFVFGLAFTMICSSFFSVNAAEPRSGGLVKIEYELEYVGNPNTNVYEEYPVSAPMLFDSKYTPGTIGVEFSKTVGSSISVTLTSSLMEELEATVGYGQSVTCEKTSSHTWSLYETGTYQVMYKVRFKTQTVIQHTIATYYDTAVGYYTRTDDTRAVYKIPIGESIYLKQS